MDRATLRKMSQPLIKKKFHNLIKYEGPFANTLKRYNTINGASGHALNKCL